MDGLGNPVTLQACAPPKAGWLIEKGDDDPRHIDDYGDCRKTVCKRQGLQACNSHEAPSHKYTPFRARNPHRPARQSEQFAKQFQSHHLRGERTPACPPQAEPLSPNYASYQTGAGHGWPSVERDMDVNRSTGGVNAIPRIRRRQHMRQIQKKGGTHPCQHPQPKNRSAPHR